MELARKAVLKASFYEDLKPIVTIDDALKQNKLLFKPRLIKKAQIKIKKSKNRIKGNFTTGSQEHFYLEGVVFVIPKEDDNFTVYSSTQHPSETQQMLQRC